VLSLLPPGGMQRRTGRKRQNSWLGIEFNRTAKEEENYNNSDKRNTQNEKCTVQFSYCLMPSSLLSSAYPRQLPQLYSVHDAQLKKSLHKAF